MVCELTLAEVNELNFRNGLERVSDFKVPTLKEAMLAAKGKIKVNLDKADNHFDDVYRIVEQTETTGQTIIKSDKPYEELKAQFGDRLDKIVAYDFSSIRYFWIGAAALSFVLCASLWKVKDKKSRRRYPNSI